MKWYAEINNELYFGLSVPTGPCPGGPQCQCLHLFRPDAPPPIRHRHDSRADFEATTRAIVKGKP